MQREEDSSSPCPPPLPRSLQFSEIVRDFPIVEFLRRKMAIAWARCPSTFSSIAIKLQFH